MRETLEAPGVAGLERSGSRPPIWVPGAGGPGLERAEINLSAWAYQPHQHDTYGIGITLTGVQAFRYRGERWVCLPGQLHILHPGETHDGAAATAWVLGTAWCTSRRSWSAALWEEQPAAVRGRSRSGAYPRPPGASPVSWHIDEPVSQRSTPRSRSRPPMCSARSAARTAGPRRIDIGLWS